MTPLDPSIDALAERLLEQCRRAGLRVATAESCTGGLLSAVLTAIAGASDVFDRGFATYSNAAKSELLGVSPELIEEHGAVSEEVARAMAEGALAHAGVDIAIAVTGVAGPGGGTPSKPVGLVHLAVARKREKTGHQRLELGNKDRQAIREESVRRALEFLISSL